MRAGEPCCFLLAGGGRQRSPWEGREVQTAIAGWPLSASIIQAAGVTHQWALRVVFWLASEEGVSASDEICRD